MEKTIGENLDPILQEIESALWEFQYHSGDQPHFPDTSLRASTKIFIDVLLDKMYDMQGAEEMSIDDKCKMAQKCGEDIRQLVKTYTGIDTFDFYKTQEDGKQQ